MHEGNLVVVLDAAAVVVASLTVLTAAGPSVALEHPRADVPASIISAASPHTLGPLDDLSASVSSDRAASVTPLENPAAMSPAGIPTDLSRLTSTRGTLLLRGLGSLPAAETARALAENPLLVERTLAAPPAPRQVDRWWSSLDRAAQLRLVSAAPQLVGNLDGVPYATRDLANRSHLRSVVDTLELADVTSLGASERVRQREQLDMLYSVLDALGPATANPPRQLVSLDVTGQGKAAIVVGDLETADYVSYIVPGMFITVQHSMVEWVDTAARLHDEQVSWLTLLAEASDDSAGTTQAGTTQAGTTQADTTEAPATPAATGSPDQAAPEVPTVATVAWIGYQTPHLLNVGSLDLAYEGRDAIASAVQGLQTLRASDAPFVSLLAHSYGSTAAMLALTETSTTVDALAMIGSPGAPNASVATLNVRGDIFVGEAAWDPIPNSSFFGPDPGSSDFGARAMSVAGGVDVITNRVLEGSTGHNAYFSPGTESMRNMALVAIDRGELVTDGTRVDALRTLESVL